jgi:PAS domain-containing protein
MKNRTAVWPSLASKTVGRPGGAESRKRIEAAVRRDPGLPVAEIAERARLSWHTTAYHLGILDGAGKVVIEKVGRDRSVFPPNVPAQQRRWVAALRVDQARQLLRLLMADPRQDIPALARHMGCTEKVVRRRIEHLAQTGLVERIGNWRPVFQVRTVGSRHIAALLLAQDRSSRSRARVGSWEWDPATGHSTLSTEGWRIIGVAPEEGRTAQSFIASFVHPEDLPGFAAVVGRALAEGLPYEHTVRLRTPQGERHIRQSGWVAARDRGGKALRFRGTLEDVTPAALRGPRHP